MKTSAITPLRFNDVAPIARHHIYGVNCYQHAIGVEPITVHHSPVTQNLSYLTLCPGNLAQRVAQSVVLPSSREMKELVIFGAKEDGLIELETRHPQDPIAIPNGGRLIALFFSLVLNDFDFHVLNSETKEWENKTPFAPVVKTDILPRILGGNYTLSRLFVAESGRINPLGLPDGDPYTYPDETCLNIPRNVRPWERGPVLKRTESGYFLPRTQEYVASPDLSFIHRHPD